MFIIDRKYPIPGGITWKGQQYETLLEAGQAAREMTPDWQILRPYIITLLSIRKLKNLLPQFEEEATTLDIDVTDAIHFGMGRAYQYLKREEKFYAGIGSRTIPADIEKLIQNVAGYLGNTKNLILRSGGAEGSDTAFQDGAAHHRVPGVIYLPWNKFSKAIFTDDVVGVVTSDWDIGAEEVASIHPYWGTMKDSVRKLMTRNVHQILGDDLHSPVNIVICWTPDGADSEETMTEGPFGTGGTGAAIRLASRLDIPVINLCNPASRQIVEKWLQPA